MLCIDGYEPALQAAIAEKARAKGITVLLNAASLSGGMGELLALSDIVIGSERFASEFAPSDHIDKSLREITRVGPRVAVITLGNEGAMALEGDKLVTQEPLDVFVADTTGAGDVFSRRLRLRRRRRLAPGTVPPLRQRRRRPQLPQPGRPRRPAHPRRSHARLGRRHASTRPAPAAQRGRVLGSGAARLAR